VFYINARYKEIIKGRSTTMVT